MEKVTVVIVISIVILGVFILAVYKLTGQATQNFGTCVDSDGDNPYLKGSVSYANNESAKTDYCLSKIKLREYYCFRGNYSIGAKRVYCAKECKNGACVK